MARNDILPVAYGDNYPLVEHGAIGSGETFLRGEPVSGNAAGNITESADDPVDADFLGIACTDGDLTNADGLASPRAPFGQFTDNGLLQAGDLVEFWLVTPTVLLITDNFSTSGSAFGGTFAGSQKYDQLSLRRISGSWGVSTSGTNLIARLIQILDSQGIPIDLRSGTGQKAVFVVSASQLNSFGAVDAPVA